MTKEIIWNKDDGMSLVLNNKYQIYFSDWCVYRLIGAKDIPQYVFKIIEKFKKEKFINLIIK